MKRICTLIILVLVCFSCVSCQDKWRNELAESYSKKDVKRLATEYIDGKYHLTDLTFGKIGKFDETYCIIDDTYTTGFKGFIIEVNDFKVYMAFDVEKEYKFSDDYQSKQIEADLQQKLKEAYSGMAYLSMDYEDALSYGMDKKLYGYNDYLHSYSTFYEGDLEKLFQKELHYKHQANIYIDGEQGLDAMSKIRGEMDQIGVEYQIFQLKDDVYKKLQEHFNDYDYMKDYLEQNGYLKKS